MNILIKCLNQIKRLDHEIMNKKELNNKIYLNLTVEESDVLKEVSIEDDRMKIIIETEEKALYHLDFNI